jgi:hypothetical protein
MRKKTPPRWDIADATAVVYSRPFTFAADRRAKLEALLAGESAAADVIAEIETALELDRTALQRIQWPSPAEMLAALDVIGPLIAECHDKLSRVDWCTRDRLARHYCLIADKLQVKPDPPPGRYESVIAGLEALMMLAVPRTQAEIVGWKTKRYPRTRLQRAISTSVRRVFDKRGLPKKLADGAVRQALEELGLPAVSETRNYRRPPPPGERKRRKATW